MSDEQMSFFYPASTETGQTAWSKEEGNARLQVIRAKHTELARQRYNAIWNDRRESNDLD